MFVVKHPNMEDVVPYYVVCKCGCEFVATNVEFREEHIVSGCAMGRADYKVTVKCSYCGNLITKDDGGVAEISFDDAAKYYLNSITRSRM